MPKTILVAHDKALIRKLLARVIVRRGGRREGDRFLPAVGRERTCSEADF